jgi:hypothetical protein
MEILKMVQASFIDFLEALVLRQRSIDKIRRMGFMSLSIQCRTLNLAVP